MKPVQATASSPPTIDATASSAETVHDALVQGVAAASGGSAAHRAGKALLKAVARQVRARAESEAANANPGRVGGPVATDQSASVEDGGDGSTCDPQDDIGTDLNWGGGGGGTWGGATPLNPVPIGSKTTHLRSDETQDKREVTAVLHRTRAGPVRRLAAVQSRQASSSRDAPRHAIGWGLGIVAAVVLVAVMVLVMRPPAQSSAGRSNRTERTSCTDSHTCAR